MEKDRRALVNRLFVTATEILEDTHIFASGGQSSGLKAKEYARTARRLSKAADDLADIAAAILVVVKA